MVSFTVGREEVLLLFNDTYISEKVIYFKRLY